MPPPDFVSVTVSSPTNIAVIKYWGKRDTKLNLPINSSVSVTIDQADLCTTTTVTASASYASDRLWLNGEEEDVDGNKRVQRVLQEVRARAGDLRDEKTGAVLLAPNSRFLITLGSGDDLSVKLWSPTGDLIASFINQQAEQYGASISADSRLVAVAASAHKGAHASSRAVAPKHGQVRIRPREFEAKPVRLLVRLALLTIPPRGR